MVAMAIPTQLRWRESIERKAWTSEARNDVFGFLAQALGLVCAAMFLYALGPVLGMTLLAVGLVVWSLLRSQIASEEEGPDEDGGYAAMLDSPSRCADAAWSRNGRLGMAAVSAHPRQGS